MKKAIETLRAMQGGIKRDILELCEEEITQEELCLALNKAQPHISKLCNELIDLGLLLTERKGVIYYRTNIERIERINQKINEL